MRFKYYPSHTYLAHITDNAILLLYKMFKVKMYVSSLCINNLEIYFSYRLMIHCPQKVFEREVVMQ